MKKFLLMLIVAAAIVCPVLAEESDWYLDMALELAGKVGELVMDDGYHRMMSGREYECIAGLKAADFTKLVSAYRCNMLDEDSLRAVFKVTGGWEMSEAALEMQVSSAPLLPITMYAGKNGADELAASVMLKYSRTFAAPENFESCAYVREMDGAVVGVAFSKTGEETVTLMAQPMLVREGWTIDDVLEAFAEDSLPMEIEKVY